VTPEREFGGTTGGASSQPHPPPSNDERQLAKLRTHWKSNKSFPSLARLADLLGMNSTGSVFEMVVRLDDGRPRFGESLEICAQADGRDGRRRLVP
jgi:hypothetical protein